ncbi:MAG: hypothetical protein GVY36_12385 [Verrucomicrobia bacterium]|jgi:hypothetical protein|nr:hypothetical protein [Verrucomicrobiota bacterium]
MQPDDDLQTTLSKWPFILGDVLLVSTALAIAILGDWQLTNWQVASCVISVALGAGLYVLPYIVEYRVRIREEAEDRSAELRILRRQFASAEAELQAVSARIEAINLNLREFGDQMDGRSLPPDLSSQLEALEAKFKALEAKLIPLVEASAAQRAEWHTLRDRVSELSASIHPPDAEDPGPTKEPTQPAPELKSDHKASISRPIRSPRKRRTVEPGLIQRAIGRREDNASAAVTRIIGGKPKETDATTKPVEKPTPQASDSPKKKPEEPEPITSPDMFAQMVPPQPNKVRRTKKPDTAVIASIFIGIGNKPYLRGSGAGLSWEQGIAMEFEAIGKWRWIAPEGLKEAVELQVYRNDEDADQKGRYTLEPGQRLQISPVFR